MVQSTRTLSAIALVFCTHPAFAQETSHATEQGRCWVASESFTPGASIRSGDEVVECQPDFSWAPTVRSAAGCILEGELSSVGAVVDAGPATSNVKTRCRADGSWENVE